MDTYWDGGGVERIWSMNKKQKKNYDNHMSRKRPLPIELLKQMYDYEDTENAEV